MSFEDFLKKIEEEAGKAPEEEPEEDEKDEEDEESKGPFIEFELDYKMSIPQWCSNYKQFGSSEAWNLCK